MKQIKTTTVGSSVKRPDAIDKTSGVAEFVADISLPGMLHGAVVRSTKPHAKILEINTEAASSMPGVVSVLTAKDIPGENIIPVVFDDQPFLADGIVRYVGEPIALVAADSPGHARRAAAAVYVIYEDLESVTDALEARNSKTVKIFGENNIFKHEQILKGNINKAFESCDAIVENEYRTPVQEHAYLETQGMLAVPRQDSVMEVSGSMQCPFYVREAIAATLGISLSKAHIIQTTTGGAFGGKEDVPSLPAAQAALLACKTEKPVKLIYTRDEDIAVTSKRHAAVIRSKYGATKDGILRAAQVEYIIDGGAYATLSPIVLFRGVIHAVGAYRCENVNVQGYAVATNNVPAGAFRGFGSPQVLFAAERQMDELAKKLRIDPFEFRRKNLLKKGDETITGQKLPWSVGAHETLEKAIEKLEGRSPLRPNSGVRNKHISIQNQKSKIKNYGVGVSTIYYGVGLGAGGEHLARTGADMKIDSDGSVTFAVGTTEIGQGMKTVLSQIAAETLGVPVSCINILPTDTTRVPDSGPTVASRATTMSGNAVKDAALQLKKKLLSVAAEILKTDKSCLSIIDECVFKNYTKTDLTYKLLIDECAKKRIGLASSGWSNVKHLDFNWETGQGDAYCVYAYATNIAEVEVDAQTGEVKLLRITAAHDVGKAVNPKMVEAQIEGGTLQGVGYALYEEIIRENGIIKNPQLSTYIIPTISDAPEILPVIVEDPYPDGPFGAKGFGEQPLMGVAPAIANAVCNALDISINEIPMTPERIRKIIKSHV